jgi:hypothetical protein
VELPYTNNRTQTTIPLGFIDPPTEILTDSVTAMSPVLGDGTQIWKITHNGVDTHAIHFHLFDVQLINRVGWDGAIRGPDANEMGWKDTVRMNPLEDCIVALRPVAPKVNFGLPDSIRPLDPTSALNTASQFTGIDPATGNPVAVTNIMYNFGWEYVWHCHLLGHEENDMMRPMVLNVARSSPTAPVLTAAQRPAAPVILNWTDATPAYSPNSMGNPASEIGYKIYRADVDSLGNVGAFAKIGQALANATSYTDSTANINNNYSYRVDVFNVTGDVPSNTIIVNSPLSVVNVTGVTLNASPVNLVTGMTFALTASIIPPNATVKDVTWSSGNTAAATVSTSGLVTAVAPGTAVITATTVQGGFTATCTIQVYPQATVTGVANGGIYTSPTTITISNGTATLNGVPFASGSTVSSDGSYALVVTNMGGGTFTINFSIDLVITSYIVDASIVHGIHCGIQHKTRPYDTCH